jgi:predicted nucleic acid-binding protein
MVTQIVVDTGPIIGLLNTRDRHHQWCVQQLEQITDPLLTCDAVLSEAFFLLKRRTPNGADQLAAMIQRGILKSQFDFSTAHPIVLSVLKKYRDLPTSFADACLVAMADASDQVHVWTLDQDFRVYRKQNRRMIPLLFPNN